MLRRALCSAATNPRVFKRMVTRTPVFGIVDFNRDRGDDAKESALAAISRMNTHAREMYADGVINVRFGVSDTQIVAFGDAFFWDVREETGGGGK